MENKNDITFGELTELWLKKIDGNETFRSAESLKSSLKTVNQDLSGCKLSEFTLEFVKSYYQKLNTKKFETGFAISKKNARSILCRYGFTRKKLRKEMKILSSTLASVYNHSKIAKKWAISFSEKTGIPYKELFDDYGNKKKYSSSTIQRLISAVRCALSFAQEQGFIEENYARKKFLKTNSCTHSKPIPPCRDDILKVLHSIAEYPDIRIRASSILMLCARFDCKKVSQICWNDFDFEKQTIRLICENNQNETVQVSADIMDIFKKYKYWQVTNEQYRSNYLFIQKNGEPIISHTVSAWFTKAIKKAGVKSFIRDFKALDKSCLSLDFDWSKAPDIELAGRQRYYQDPMRKEMTKLGFRTYNEYLDYLEFTEKLREKMKKREME